MQTSITRNKIKDLLRTCLSKPASLCKTRRETIIEAAMEQGLRQEEAIELSYKVMTLWTAVDLTIEQFIENCMKSM